ncbi:MAG: hypothetical protein ABSG08_16655 [Terriglobales bacterium]
MPQRAQDVKYSLEVKGFRESTEGTRDHHYYFFYRNGKKTNILTKISHGEREITDDNCSNMAHQMKLSTSQFHEFVACPLTLEEYLKLLIAGRHLREQSQQQAQRSLISDKAKKREVLAHCDKCNRTFSGSRKSGEKEADVLLRMKKDFDLHQCNLNISTHS